MNDTIISVDVNISHIIYELFTRASQVRQKVSMTIMWLHFSV